MKNACVALTLLALCAQAVPYNEVAVDFAVAADAEPVLDGRLDESVWREAVVRTRFYEYYKPHPKEAPIKSEMRLLYTERALWIGLVHHEPHPEALKVLAAARDAVDWYEDMDEIYVDPSGSAVGYLRFSVNSAGVIGDMRRIDGSVVQNEWSGTQWAAKTTVDKDRWTVEVCLPYGDLSRKPEPDGGLWRFCVTRYQWTTGKFVGSVSSPRGSSNNPGGFGYLFFLPRGATADAQSVIRHVAPNLTPPWCTQLPDALLADDGSGVRKWSGEDVGAFLAEEERKDAANAAAWRERLEREFGGSGK